MDLYLDKGSNDVLLGVSFSICNFSYRSSGISWESLYNIVFILLYTFLIHVQSNMTNSKRQQPTQPDASDNLTDKSSEVTADELQDETKEQQKLQKTPPSSSASDLFKICFGHDLQNFRSLSSFTNWLQRPVDGAALGVFRMLFGAAMLIDVAEERGGSQLDVRYGEPQHCHFPLFNGMRALDYPLMGCVYLCLWFGALGIMLGYRFRASCLTFVSCYWYIFLLNKPAWNNHSYLFGLTGTLLLFSQANCYWWVTELISGLWTNLNHSFRIQLAGQLVGSKTQTTRSLLELLSHQVSVLHPVHVCGPEEVLPGMALRLCHVQSQSALALCAIPKISGWGTHRPTDCALVYSLLRSHHCLLHDLRSDATLGYSVHDQFSSNELEIVYNW